MPSIQVKNNQPKKIAGVILAAGSSNRLGSPKQLLTFGGKTFIEAIVDTAIQSDLTPIIVVLGASYEEIQPVLIEYSKRIKVVHNKEWESGQSSSLRIAVEEIKNISDAAIFFLVDQPQIPAELIVGLKNRFMENKSTIIVPFVGEKRTNPVLFSKSTYTELSSITGDQGGRVLFEWYNIDKLSWNDQRITIDVDTLEDYENLKRAYA
jgi:molybdenum cofactor cytidylyltransferase